MGLLFGLYIALPFVFLPYVVPYLQCLFSDNENSEQLISYLSISAIGLPVFTLLWIFRTYDTREQIQKSQEQVEKTQEQIKQSREQIEQNELFKALSDLATNNPLAIKTAVLNLIEIDKRNENYREQIQVAFIERLKQKVISEEYFPIKDNFDLKLTYAQYILKWLAENEKQVNRDDLRGCCFDRQEFEIDGFKKNDEKPSPFTILFNKEKHPRAYYLSFVKANLIGVDLRGTNLIIANLIGADLRGIDLSGTILKKTNLNESVLLEYTEAITNSRILDGNWKDEEKIAKAVKDYFKKSKAPNLYLARLFISDVNEYPSGLGHYKKSFGLILEQDPNIE